MAKNYPFLVQKRDPAIQVPAAVDLIVRTQEPDGAIPWWIGDKTDPWDHVEAAMGLSIGGALAQARKAFEWLKNRQFDDGGWAAAYKNGEIIDGSRETNHAAYIAVGLYHYLLITNDIPFVKRMWPSVVAAIEFALRHQGPGGEIYWALNPQGQVDRMALLTGCSSICFSLRCALALAQEIGEDKPHWLTALKRLQACIQNEPFRFNMTKSRFSMDWFYPVLCGALQGDRAKAHIEKHWKKFVVQNMGVRCVSDQPWVTIAESSELVLALAAMGNHLLAHIVFSWICDHTFSDGTFWCGFTFPDMVLWPEEKLSWTNAVVLMAADALFGLTPAAKLFSHARWKSLGL